MKLGEVVVEVVRTVPKKTRGSSLSPLRNPKLLSTTRTGVTIARRKLVLEHRVAERGFFVDGLLEVWRVIRPLGRSSIGSLSGSSEEVLVWAPTEFEVIEKAERVLL